MNVDKSGKPLSIFPLKTTITNSIGIVHKLSNPSKPKIAINVVGTVLAPSITKPTKNKTMEIKSQKLSH